MKRVKKKLPDAASSGLAFLERVPPLASAKAPAAVARSGVELQTRRVVVRCPVCSKRPADRQVAVAGFVLLRVCDVCEETFESGKRLLGALKNFL